MQRLVPELLRIATLPLGWQRAITAISLLWIATAAGACMAFLTQTLLARELGPATYGLFASSLATVSMVAPLGGFGLSQFWLKAYGVEGWMANRWLSPSLRFIAGTTTLALSVVAVWAFTGAPADDTRFTLLVLMPVVLGVLVVNLVGSKLRLEERYGTLAVWQMTIPASRLLVALLLLLIPSLAGRFVAIGYSAISLWVVVLALPSLRMMLSGKIKLQGHGECPTILQLDKTPRVLQVWAQSWAYGLEAVLYSIFFQVSTVQLKYLGSDIQAGMFGIALAVMMAIYLVPATIYQKFLLSKLHRWAVHDKKKFWFVYRKGNIVMLATGLIVGALMAVVSPWLIPLAFGEKYRGVVKILLVLALCVPIRFLSTGVGSALLNERHMRYRVIAMGLAAAVTIILNVLLIPSCHELGAAWSTVVGETLLLLTFYLGVRRFYGTSC